MHYNFNQYTQLLVTKFWQVEALFCEEVLFCGEEGACYFDHSWSIIVQKIFTGAKVHLQAAQKNFYACPKLHEQVPEEKCTNTLI